MYILIIIQPQIFTFVTDIITDETDSQYIIVIFIVIIIVNWYQRCSFCVLFKEWRHTGNDRRGTSHKICLCTGIRCNNNDSALILFVDSEFRQLEDVPLQHRRWEPEREREREREKKSHRENQRGSQKEQAFVCKYLKLQHYFSQIVANLWITSILRENLRICSKSNFLRLLRWELKPHFLAVMMMIVMMMIMIKWVSLVSWVLGNWWPITS